MGKITGNDTRIKDGEDKAHGSSGRASEGDHTDKDHPGITYTKKGAMKQINMGPPPPSSTSPTNYPISLDEGNTTSTTKDDATDVNHPGIGYTKHGAMRQPNIRPPPSNPDDPASIDGSHNDPHTQRSNNNDHSSISFTDSGAMKQTCIQNQTPTSIDDDQSMDENKWTADTTGTYDFGNNFDTHPHENYAGPNLTKTLTSPVDDEDLAIVQAKQGQEERYDLLHGGFPTGAPSPGLRGRGAEVIDKFDR